MGRLIAHCVRSVKGLEERRIIFQAVFKLTNWLAGIIGEILFIGGKMRKFLVILLGCAVAFSAVAEENTETQKNIVVAKFIEAVKSGVPSKIAKFVEYPLERPHHIPDIQNEADFIKRFEMVFDKDMLEGIAKTKPENWEHVGWRGIMLPPGYFWLDDSGKLIATNVMTDKEEQYILDWEKTDRENLLANLRQFDKNMYIFEVMKGMGRIDRIPTDKEKEYVYTYRYAFWNTGKKMSDEPDIVIENGEVEYQGSGGNHTYIFKNGAYVYEFDVIRVGLGDYDPYVLSVLRDKEYIVSYVAEIVK